MVRYGHDKCPPSGRSIYSVVVILETIINEIRFPRQDLCVRVRERFVSVESLDFLSMTRSPVLPVAIMAAKK